MMRLSGIWNYAVYRKVSSLIKDLVRHDPSKRIGDARTCLTLLNRLDRSITMDPDRCVQDLSEDACH